MSRQCRVMSKTKVKTAHIKQRFTNCGACTPECGGAQEKICTGGFSFNSDSYPLESHTSCTQDSKVMDEILKK